MEQLINGRFEYEVPKLVLSDTKITVEIKAGENYRGELFIGAEDNRRMKGMVMSSNRRLLLGKEKFSGAAVCIPYGIDGRGLNPGDELGAAITINSNLGEYQVPVFVKVQNAQIYTSLGEIRSLEDFTKLAANDYREAFRLFTKDVFPEIIKKEDKEHLCLYHGMSHNPVTYQHMEEFLIGAGKKEPVRIYLEQEEKKYDRIADTIKDSLYLGKRNWGYANIEVEVQGNFLSVEKKIISSDDFIGSVYELEYFIHKDKLGIGKRYGKILIHTVYETLEFQITVCQKEEYMLSTYLFEKRIQANLAKSYQKYCLGECSREEWRDYSLSQIEELKNMGCCYPKHQLMEGFIHYEMGDVAACMAALWPLREIEFTQEQMEEEGVYLLLAVRTGVATEAQCENARSRVETLHRMQPNSWILLKAYMEMEEEYKTSAARQLYMYEELFEVGCVSPFLYIEAYKILEKEESQLKKLSPFMIQVLSYGTRYGKMTEELTMRIGHLSGYVKQFQNSLYRLMVNCYETYPGKELLDHICKYIMKGQPRKKEYFRWYSQAVEQDLRITRLYEYYIETMPEAYQNVMPQVIRKYFAYNNTLSSRKRASVYANVIRNKEVDKTTYQSYRKSMEQFALEALKNGKINEDYAVIYQECVKTLTSVSVAEELANVMFTYRIFCDDSKIHKVIVCHEQLEKEDVYVCKEGVAYIQLFTPEAKIIFEDGKRRRYAATVDYNLQKLMNEKNYIGQCIALDVSYYGLLLAVCEGTGEIGVQNLGCYQKAARMDIFKESYRHEICRWILEYYAKHAGDDTLDNYLRKMDYMTFAQVNKALLAEILIEKGMYEMAFEIIKNYGYEGIRAESLMKLASRMILRMEFVELEELVYLAMYAFEQGKYDEIILTYLSDNLLGSLEQMVTLWERMRGFQMDTYALEEEIMLLAMFGRVYLKQGDQILKSYVQQGGKQQVILAYVSLWAYDYFLGEKETQEYIFECLEICLERKWELDRICRLALLKYYANKEKLTEKQETYVRLILEECNEAGLRFGFYQKLPVSFTKPYQMDDKQFVERKFSAKAKVMIHYQILKDDGTMTEEKSEPVKNMYQGIFVKEFLLFYGETLHYHLTVETEKDTYQTQEKTLRMEDSFQKGTSKYQLINQMLAGRKLNQDERMEEAMEQYLIRERLAEKMFQLVE